MARKEGKWFNIAKTIWNDELVSAISELSALMISKSRIGKECPTSNLNILLNKPLI